MACSFACPASAIKMQPDECGFLYPQIDSALCIHCNLCQKVCPLQTTYVGTDAQPSIYALQNTSKEVVANSSSGGMYTLLADWILEQNGVIYGVAFDQAFQVRHLRADSKEDAQAFRTSKYVQSDPAQVYETICDDLKKQVPVLVTGTPCQISGILHFLSQKHADTANLYTCDNICHGVPSPGVWTDYLEILRNRYLDSNVQITGINMRSKRLYWKKQVMDVQLSDGSLLKAAEDFSFNKIFLSNYVTRPSCSHCHFTSFSRPADFSLGDFWNVDTAGITFSVEGGVNEVLVNTPKGEELFSHLKERAVCQQVSKTAGWQPHLEYSAKAPSNKEAFWKEYIAAADKEPVLRKYMKGSLLTRIIRKVNPLLQKTGLYNFAGKMYKLVFVRK